MMSIARSVAVLLFAALLALPATASALDKDDPFGFQPMPVQKIALAVGGSTELTIEFQVFSEDFFLYRDMSSVDVVEAAGLTVGEAKFPKGKVKFDKISGEEREIFGHTFKVVVPVTVPEGAAAGAHEVKLGARLQGCNIPENYCLFPESEEYSFRVTVAGDEGGAPAVGAGAKSEAGDEGDEGDRAIDGAVLTPEIEAADAVETTGAATLIAANGSVDDATPASDNCMDEAGSKGGASAGIVDKVLGILKGATGEKGSAAAAASTGPAFLFLVMVFLGGLASSLTPCVYPMIPITISVIGASADQGRLKSFSLAVVYVGGICATYTVLGLFAAQSGGMFGAALQNPLVLVGVAAVMLILAAAMFGFYEFALPSSLTTKASMIGGGGYVGAFIVGTVAGIVAAPCTGPIVAFLLIEIATKPGWSVADGALVMLTYSLGLGMLFLVIGTFAGFLASMPRSGTWMVTVKYVFGAVLLGATVFYVGQAVTVAYSPEEPSALAAGLMTAAWVLVVVVAAAVAAGMKDALGPDRKPARLVLAVAVLAIGLFLLFAPEDHDGVELTWNSSHDDGLALASTEGRPAILDFTAEWCAACKELEHFTYTDPAVVKCGAEFVPIMVDGTKETPEFDALRSRYGFKGLPAVYFICPGGEVVEDLTLTGFESADRFLQKMNVALSTCEDHGNNQKSASRAG